MAFNDGHKMCTTSGEPVDKVRSEQTNQAGQHKGYVVLCAEERAKGFVRPYRDSYKHVGPKGPCHDLEDLSPDDGRFEAYGYVKHEIYRCSHIVDPNGPTPECGYPSTNERHDNDSEMFLHDYKGRDGSSIAGRYWTQAQLDAATKGGCGQFTTMIRALSETYARDPSFYGATFCVRCNRHLSVSEFVWAADGERVGS